MLVESIGSKLFSVPAERFALGQFHIVRGRGVTQLGGTTLKRTNGHTDEAPSAGMGDGPPRAALALGLVLDDSISVVRRGVPVS